MTLEMIASLAMPALLLVASVILVLPGRERFPAFLDGAKSGLECAVSLFPGMTLLMCGAGMLGASGFYEIVASLLSGVCDALGIPTGALPLVAVRPFSGSASSASLAEIIATFGANSREAIFGAVFYSSAETSLYVTAVYFSSVGVRKTRWALPAALTVLVFALFCTSFVLRRMGV